MGRARLTRIDAVREMAAAVDAFRNEAIAALEGLDMDIRRALEWIHGDRREHWDHEVRRGWDRITQARIQLQQARTVRRVGDHEPACPDEKKALDRAKRRLETAQAKVEAVRHCARAIDEAVNEYRGAKTPLASWLESEAFKAIAALRRMMDHLDSYVAMQAPSAAATSPPLPPGEGRREGKDAVDTIVPEVASTQYAVPSFQEQQPSTVEQSQTVEQVAAAPGTVHCVLSTGDRTSGTDEPPQSEQPATASKPSGGPA
jgi:hypothetical protein